MNEVYSLAKKLIEDYDLSDYEALNLSLQFQRNDILKSGLVVSGTDSRPSALESIAMSMGEKPN